MVVVEEDSKLCTTSTSICETSACKTSIQPNTPIIAAASTNEIPIFFTTESSTATDVTNNSNILCKGDYAMPPAAPTPTHPPPPQPYIGPDGDDDEIRIDLIRSLNTTTDKGLEWAFQLDMTATPCISRYGEE